MYVLKLDEKGLTQPRCIAASRAIAAILNHNTPSSDALKYCSSGRGEVGKVGPPLGNSGPPLPQGVGIRGEGAVGRWGRWGTREGGQGRQGRQGSRGECSSGRVTPSPLHPLTASLQTTNH
jgi:hypothetical protein